MESQSDLSVKCGSQIRYQGKLGPDLPNKWDSILPLKRMNMVPDPTLEKNMIQIRNLRKMRVQILPLRKCWFRTSEKKMSFRGGKVFVASFFSFIDFLRVNVRQWRQSEGKRKTINFPAANKTMVNVCLLFALIQ